MTEYRTPGAYNPWAIALTVTLATFMETLDTSVANVALPHIAGSLSASQDEATWVLTSYLVSNAVVLPISGWLATRIGRKRYYMLSVALFTVASFLCGMAPSLGVLIFFRVLQGIGGGGLAPTEQAILADTFPEEKRGMAFAVYAMAVILAPALGPTLGGFITDNYSWRWIFLINIPVGLISLLLSGRMLSDPPHLVAAKSKAGSVDVIGLALLAIGLGTLEVVLDKGQEDDWFHSGFITAFSLASAVALIAFVVWEWRQEHPVVDVKLFKSRGFATSALMMLILGVCMYSTTVLLPQYLQIWLGYSAFDAGMVLSPGALVLLFIMPLVGWAVAKIDVRYLLAAGFALTAAALFTISQKLYPGIDFGTATLLRVYQMVGMALLFVPINTVAYAGVAPGKNEAVSGIVNLARNLGGDIGISFVNTVIARRSQVHQANLVEHVNRLNPLSSQHIGGMTQHFANQHGSVVDSTRQALAGLYSQVLQQAQTLAYIDTLRALAFVSLITVPFVFTLRKMKPGKAAMAH